MMLYFLHGVQVYEKYNILKYTWTFVEETTTAPDIETLGLIYRWFVLRKNFTRAN